MSKKAEINFNENKFFVSGFLDFTNVMCIYEKSLLDLKASQCAELEFDFSKLTSCNSAGLALIIEWVKLAKKMDKPIKFYHLSKELMSIAEVMGLEQLIHCAQNGKRI